MRLFSNPIPRLLLTLLASFGLNYGPFSAQAVAKKCSLPAGATIHLIETPAATAVGSRNFRAVVVMERPVNGAALRWSHGPQIDRLDVRQGGGPPYWWISTPFSAVGRGV